MERTRRVIDAGRRLGFAMIGVTPATASDRAAYVRDWLARGRHGQMDYLERNLDARLDPRKLLPGARSVVCVVDRYDAKAPGVQGTGAPRGRVARYAWGRDYHKVMKKRLHALADELRAEDPDEQFRATVDTAPLHEREHASRAGLGWIGKHTLLLHPRRGSWLLLGTIVTTLKLADSESLGWPDDLVPPVDHCGTCTRCIDACPTQCITPYQLDASRCISYLTIEHRDVIPADLHAAMGDWVAGCDVCQEVCPHNRGSGNGEQGTCVLPDYAPGEVAHGFNLLDVLGWTEDDRRDRFRGSALKRIKLDMMKRNALIAAGNFLHEHNDAALRERIAQIADDEIERELVRITARQVLNSRPASAPPNDA